MNVRKRLKPSLLFLLIMSGSCLQAHFVHFETENVPIDRVIGNLERRIAEKPNDVPARIDLARVHAMAYATKTETAPCRQVDEKRRIDVRKQVDGIVAHLVHSQDATHMMLTVNCLKREGIDHFAMVHDSYGVHACDVDLLHRLLREEFVRMYSEPVLIQFFKEQWEANRGIVIPALPPPGALDIRQVLQSLYFFA